MQIRRTRRKAVAPVLATLMMIAVAVAMSVIIFVWSQGFLSQTSSAAGGQQSQQNLAASSGISLETSVFTAGTGTAGQVTIVVRNVGSVAEQLGSVQIQGVPSNSGLTSGILCTVSASTGDFTCTSTLGKTTNGPTGTVTPTVDTASTLAKGAAATMTITLGDKDHLASGDSVNIKVSTTVGTFATQQYTVP